ncbi:MAG: hypothetical protein QGI21_07210 [Candidatus Poseidoniaceae archaeon]|jgi:hypothetical protein|nr:hypothetical protein [Candidatus Poseidoniaceae archaeon]
MEIQEGPFGLRFIQINSGSVFVGTNKGGWIHASERPHHQVNLPAFLILESPLTIGQVKTILGQKTVDENLYEEMNLDTLNQICEKLSKHFDDEVRAPSESEWLYSNDKLNFYPGYTEFLADEATSNHRGARLDGRPRLGDLDGPMSGHRVAYATHPNNSNTKQRFSTPADRPLPKVVARLVVSPKRVGIDHRVPENANLMVNIQSEIFWTFVLGIIPSFSIPVIRGFGDYATEGWANLLFGGLCAGFLTGAFWRPKRPTWGVNKDEVIRLD